MTAQLSRIVYRIGNPENDQHHFTEQKDHADIAKNNGYEVSEYVLAGMGSEPFGFAHNFETFEDDTVRISKEQNRHYGKPLYAAPPAPVAAESIVPDGLHPDTAELVIRFATALAEKLHRAEQKYGHANGWMAPGWYNECLQQFWEHIAKGDPRDVAAYCAFMWYHGWKTKPAPVAVPDERKAFDEFMEKRFKDSINRRQVKNGDGEYMAWDMQVAWVAWQARATLLKGDSKC